MQEFTERQATALAAMVDPDRFSTGQSNRELHLHDISFHQGKLPAGIVWPVATEEVSRVMAWAYENEVPVTPWGAGTSTEGNPVPTRGGLVVDLTRMNRVLEIRPQDLQADVQPGVLRKELNRQAGQHGLFFPPDPGADATIGGMIANNASGVQTVKYGATKDYVMRLTVVLPGRPRHPHRLQGPQVLGRLRPHAPLRGLGGDPRDRDRGHPEADGHPQPLPGRDHPLPGPREGLAGGRADDRLRARPGRPRAPAARADPAHELREGARACRRSPRSSASSTP